MDYRGLARAVGYACADEGNLAVRSKKKVCVVDPASYKILGDAEVGNTPKRNLVITLEGGEGKASK